MIASTVQCSVILRTLLALVPLSVRLLPRILQLQRLWPAKPRSLCFPPIRQSAGQEGNLQSKFSLIMPFFLPYSAKASGFAPAQCSHRITLPEVWADSESFSNQRLLL